MLQGTVIRLQNNQRNLRPLHVAGYFHGPNLMIMARQKESAGPIDRRFLFVSAVVFVAAIS